MHHWTWCLLLWSNFGHTSFNRQWNLQDAYWRRLLQSLQVKIRFYTRWLFPSIFTPKDSIDPSSSILRILLLYVYCDESICPSVSWEFCTGCMIFDPFRPASFEIVSACSRRPFFASHMERDQLCSQLRLNLYTLSNNLWFNMHLQWACHLKFVLISLNCCNKTATMTKLESASWAWTKFHSYVTGVRINATSSHTVHPFKAVSLGIDLFQLLHVNWRYYQIWLLIQLTFLQLFWEGLLLPSSQVVSLLIHWLLPLTVSVRTLNGCLNYLTALKMLITAFWHYVTWKTRKKAGTARRMKVVGVMLITLFSVLNLPDAKSRGTFSMHIIS